MAELRVLHDSKLHPYYLGLGNYRNLLPYIHFKRRWWSFTDKIILRAQKLIGFGKTPDIRATMSFDKIKRCIELPIKSMLLYYTGWYKDILYAGFVEDERSIKFVKIFQKPEDLVFQTHQTRFVQSHFSGPFVISSIISSQDTVMISEFFYRKRNVTADDSIEQKIIHLSDTLCRNATTHKLPLDIMPIDMNALCFGTEYFDLYKTIMAWINRQNDTLPIIPVHGDLTPWNLFVNKDEKIILVDYERAGWHVPYYDYFHYLLQPKALQPSAPSILKIVFDSEYPALRNALVMYLIDQIYHDLTDHLQNGFAHKQLKNLITNKTKWLQELIGE